MTVARMLLEHEGALPMLMVWRERSVRCETTPGWRPRNADEAGRWSARDRRL